jgi:hypothetical protein
MRSLTLLTFVGGVPEMAAFYQRLGVTFADAEPPWDASPTSTWPPRVGGPNTSTARRRRHV